MKVKAHNPLELLLVYFQDKTPDPISDICPSSESTAKALESRTVLLNVVVLSLLLTLNRYLTVGSDFHHYLFVEIKFL